MIAIAPPISQTPTIRVGVETCRATSAGLTKMPEPMIPPMTSMVASNRPSRRTSFGSRSRPSIRRFDRLNGYSG